MMMATWWKVPIGHSGTSLLASSVVKLYVLGLKCPLLTSSDLFLCLTAIGVELHANRPDCCFMQQLPVNG
jgi:hypothetical protein